MVGCSIIGKLIDLTGKRFGRLLVLRRNGTASDGTPLWECQCECGNIRNIRGTSLRKGNALSCGCLHSEITFKRTKKYNNYDLSGEYGIGWTSNTNNEFYFDLEDYDKIKNHCWFENDQGYICTRIYDENKNIRLHQFVTGFKYKLIDHKNTNKKDNRKFNLRPSDKQTNNINRDANCNNKLGIKGVFKTKNGSYMAKIERNGRIYTKTNKNLDIVVNWRHEKEKELYGEFAYKYYKKEV